ncbi:hypothetical protein D3C71_1867540 [compost metagenome]
MLLTDDTDNRRLVGGGLEQGADRGETGHDHHHYKGNTMLGNGEGQPKHDTGARQIRDKHNGPPVPTVGERTGYRSQK